MVMPNAAPLYSADELRAWPDDGQRYEVVHGELLVSPAPRFWHQELVDRLLVALRLYLVREPIGSANSSPADISWDERTLVQPDLFVVALDEARTGDWARIKTLLLAVEVLSPSSHRADRVIKRQLYQAHGVGTYWIVDTDARRVELLTPTATAPVLLIDRLTWHPDGAIEPFVMSLEELFRPM